MIISLWSTISRANTKQRKNEKIIGRPVGHLFRVQKLKQQLQAAISSLQSPSCP